MFAAFLVGASFIGAEYSTGSLANWLTFVPQRLKVYGSKVIAVVLALGRCVGAVAVLRHARSVALRTQVARQAAARPGSATSPRAGGRAVVLVAARRVWRASSSRCSPGTRSPRSASRWATALRPHGARHLHLGRRRPPGLAAAVAARAQPRRRSSSTARPTPQYRRVVAGRAATTEVEKHISFGPQRPLLARRSLVVAVVVGARSSSGVATSPERGHAVVPLATDPVSAAGIVTG